jgi:hypothetical protein
LANFLPERDVKVPMIKPVKDFFEVARVLMQTVEAAFTSEVSADDGLGRVVMIRDQTNAWLGLQGEAILKSLSLEAVSLTIRCSKSIVPSYSKMALNVVEWRIIYN